MKEGARRRNEHKKRKRPKTEEKMGGKYRDVDVRGMNGRNKHEKRIRPNRGKNMGGK